MHVNTIIFDAISGHDVFGKEFLDNMSRAVALRIKAWAILF